MPNTCRKKHKGICIKGLAWLLLLTVWLPLTVSGQNLSNRDVVWQINIDGIIGPASADYLTNNINAAQANGAQFLLIKLNTPGGLDTSMREIVQAILAAPLPVVLYVTPAGARAASAGTYLLYASHVAAMTPATNLGAATPVQLGTPGLPQPGGEQPQTDSDNNEESAEPSNAMERKMVNDAVAFITGLAELRSRNAEWAEQAVRWGASLTAKDALEQQVIDIVADDKEDLLAQLDQREVEINGTTIILNTSNVTINEIDPNWRTQFLKFVTNPNVAYILMLIGIYGLIFEFSNPGLGAPGLIGVVSLMLALYAFHVLPVSYLGLALVAIGIGLMVFEAFSPSFGLAGIGGIIIFIIGSISLMDTNIPAYQIALPVILAVTTVSAVLVFILLSMVIRSTRRRTVSGVQTLENQEATVEAIHQNRPMVRINGELWQVQANQPLEIGDRVTVKQVNNLNLVVERQT